LQLDQAAADEGDFIFVYTIEPWKRCPCAGEAVPSKPAVAYTRRLAGSFLFLPQCRNDGPQRKIATFLFFFSKQGMGNMITELEGLKV